jgi:putative nucleotidyltransferase with HDIG domain
MATNSSAKPIYISVNQLCVGVFVHLDRSWMDHSFTLSSFKIKSVSQIDEIKRMGLEQIRVDPHRSDCRPLPLPSVETVAIETPSPLSPDDHEAIAEKRARVDRLVHIRAAAAQCEKELLKAAGAMKEINRHIYSQPRKAFVEADSLVDQMLASLLTDKDIAIHLMNDKTAGDDVYYHSLNVAVMSMMLGKEMGLSPIEIKDLGMGCLFHDIGKIEIPDRIVRKVDPLTRAEDGLMQQHCRFGEVIGARMDLSKEALLIISQHHEHVDGTGYPAKLAGPQISQLARIVAIVNTYDNHCNKPNVKDSLSPAKALSYMFAHQRDVLDAPALNVFIHCLGVYPPGTIVVLSNNMTGLVVSVNARDPLRPSVLVYDPDTPKAEAIILDLLSEPDIQVSRSINPAQLPREIYAYLSPRSRMTYYFDAPKAGARASK